MVDIYYDETSRYCNIIKVCKNNKILKEKVINDMLKNYKSIEGKYEKIDRFISDLLIYIKYNTDFPEYK